MGVAPVVESGSVSFCVLLPGERYHQDEHGYKNCEGVHPGAQDIFFKLTFRRCVLLFFREKKYTSPALEMSSAGRRRRVVHSVSIQDLEKRIRNLEQTVKMIQKAIRAMQENVREHQRNEWQEERDLVTAEWDNQPGDVETDFLTDDMLQQGRSRHRSELQQRFARLNHLGAD